MEQSDTISTTGPQDSGDNRREDIERAFEQVETRDAPPGAAPASPPATSRAAPDAQPGSPPAAPAPGERTRGPDGRFTSSPDEPQAKPLAKPLAKPQATPQATPSATPSAKPADAQRPPEQPQAPQPRAPQSWKPAAREHWQKLPPEVQQEVSRREVEVARTLKESSQAREVMAQVQSVLGPYAHNAAAAGTDALSMIGSLMKADNTLRHGSLAEKASLVANIIQSYGVNIEALDQVLAGKAPTADPNAQLAEQLRREMQQQMQPMMSYFQQMQGQRENALAQISQNASNDVASFAEANEFFEDVRQDMADIIDLYTRRGQTISLQDAYDRAIKLNPQVSEIVSRRAEQQRASAAAQAAQAARRKAISVSGAPAPAGAGPGADVDDRRAVIAAAFDQHANG